MSNVFDKLDELLTEAIGAAKMERAGFGFPHERIEVKVTHFSNERSGKPGDLVHPTDYIKRQTELYRDTWVVSPIERARDILRANAELVEMCARLGEAMQSVDMIDLVRRAQGDRT